MRVALYIRVSTDEQAEEGFSIEAQERNLTEFCIKNNHQIVEIYRDEGISGKTIDMRPALLQLLRDCKRGLFEMVAVWKTSRISRKQVDFLKIIEELDKNNICFYSLSENLSATTPLEKVTLHILGSIAQYERDTILENAEMGRQERAKSGKWCGGAILGYESVNKSLVVVQSEANIVRRIFDLYVSGKGYKAIANQLNHEGYKTKRRRAFSINSVRQTLNNCTYAGYISYAKHVNWSDKRRKGKNNNPIIAKGEHEPIISNMTWNKAQEIGKLKSHKPTKTFFGNFSLTTLLRCPICGQGMIGARTKNSSGEYIRYYQCGNFHYKGSAVCHSNMLRADYAENYVFERIQNVVSNKAILEEIVKRVNEKIARHKDPLKERFNYTQEQIKKVNSNIEKYMLLFENGKSSLLTVRKRLETLEDELTQLQIRQRELQMELSQPTIKEVSFEYVHKVLSNFSNIFPEVEPEKQKDLLHSIINKITFNMAKKMEDRCIKDIELYFDTSINTDFVLTCGMSHY